MALLRLATRLLLRSGAPGRRVRSPAGMIVLSFALLIMTGAVLLSLPIAREEAAPLAPLDALFTAVSAVCITGLSVIDVGTTFSTFGEVVLLVLIQLGGIGVITAASFVAIITGRRLGVSERLQVTQAVGGSTGTAASLVITVIAYSLAFEFAGFLALTVAWWSEEGARAPHLALFHAVSAFNNAGFSLYPDSLIRYATDPATSLIISSLVILGGLGFVAILNLVAYYRSGRRAGLTLTTRIVVASTVLLLVGATVIFALIEWTNPVTLGEMTVPEKLLAAFSMAVMPRTAGFNVVDYVLVTPASNFLTVLLMFIGGSPSSTAGGIKTVTFFVLVASTLSFTLRRQDPVAFGRRFELPLLQKAQAVAFVAVQVIAIGFTGLALTEKDIEPVKLVFESVSAFATVGLSMNTTPQLTDGGRVIVMALMFLGRVGLITFALALAQRRSGTPLRYPAEDAVIG
jgi:trk system potassium uptake protein TrkH